MLKLLALNYNVMLNGYSQWLNIRGHSLEGNQYQLVSVILAFSHKKKMTLNKHSNILYLCCLYIHLKIEWDFFPQIL